MRTSVFLGAFLLLLLPDVSQAQNACSLISCDCSSISNNVWQAECRTREDSIKSRCRSSAGERIGACIVAGKSAWPLMAESQGSELLPTWRYGEDQFDDWFDSQLETIEAVNFQLSDARSWTAGQVRNGAYSQVPALASTLSDLIRQFWWINNNQLRAEAKFDEDPVDEDDLLAVRLILREMLDEQNQLASTIAGTNADANIARKALYGVRYELYQMLAETYTLANDYNRAGELWRDAAREGESVIRLDGLNTADQRQIALDVVSSYFLAATRYDLAGDATLARQMYQRANDLKSNPSSLIE